MLMLTQTGCALPTALACCSWESPISPSIDPAAPAVNTTVILKTLTAFPLPAGTSGDSIVVLNNGANAVPVSPIADALAVGEVGIFVHNGSAWARG